MARIFWSITHVLLALDDEFYCPLIALQWKSSRCRRSPRRSLRCNQSKEAAAGTTLDKLTAQPAGRMTENWSYQFRRNEVKTLILQIYAH